MFWTLIKRYWDVSCFKETPDNTPYSLLLLLLVACCFLLLVVMQWMLADVEGLFTFSTALLAGFTLLLSYGLYTLGLLYVFKVSNRTVQGLTCLLAGHALVHLFAFPLLLLAPLFAVAQMPALLAFILGVIYLVLTLALTIWQLMVSVHIYKHALSIAYFPAVLASLGLVACNILMVSLWMSK